MRAVVLLLALSLWPLSAAAQTANATARISQDVVEVGAQFQYQADASVRGGEQIKLISAPDFGELKPVGQQRVPQIITINGVTEHRLSLRYALVAASEGTFEIQPPTFSIGREKVRPGRTTVTVVKKGATPKKQSRKRDSRYFIDATIEPEGRAPYVGEQLTLRYDLYVDGAQMDVQPSNSREPSLDDFWIQELTDRVARADQMVSVNGRLYKRTSLWSYALFPLQAGPVGIEPAEVELVVGSFFRRGQPAHLESEPIQLNVKPLPPNAPNGFYEGNVGNWSFRVRTDQSSTRVGRAFVVEVTATGEGQVSRIRLPTLPSIDGARTSDVDESSTPHIRGLSVGGIAKAEYTLTPLSAGQITIPAMEFTWFDPTQGEYRSTRSKPIVVNVAAGELGPAPVQPEEIAKRNVAADEDLIANLVAELKPLREPPTVDAAPDPSRSPWFYWVLIAGSFIGFLWVSFGPRLRRFARRAAPEREQKNLAGAAVERLDEAGSDASELARAIRAGLHEAWNIPLGAVTSSELESAFAKRDLDPEVARELAHVLRECETARFAPGTHRLSADMVSKARRALEKLAAAVVVFFALAGPARAADLQELAAQHPRSVDVQYNLGTQAAADGDYAKARVALERATYLAPWDSDVEHNRALVERIVRLNTIERSRTGRTMEGDETLFWWKVAVHLNPHLLGLLAVLFWVLAAVAVRVRRNSDSPPIRDTAVVCLVLAVLLGVTATFAATARSRILEDARPVVVMTDELELREGPNAAASLKRTPPAIVPGTLLRIIDERDEWVKLTWQGDSGWTHRDAVQRVDE